jgi:hypothetical protein
MLDSIRDSAFLGTPGSQSTDFGLGITDNPLFFFTSYYTTGMLPGGTTPRLYPIKLFWLGSPLGTNDLTDTFGIYVGDVVPVNFVPGAPPNIGGPSTSWLVNPRLVLSSAQAKTDIINWFNANYPGVASGGVGISNAGSNSTYGTLAGGTSAVGNVAGITPTDGQYWPIYDYVDNSILLYFSVKVPNCNTLSLYCYKQTDSEMSAPLGSSQFLGGLFAPAWTIVDTSSTLGANLLSSHRFSIVSPDPLVNNPRVSGTQSAVLMYSYGVLDGLNPDHGGAITGSVVNDVHGHPLAPGLALTAPATSGSPPITAQVSAGNFYPVDKLGSIFAADSVDAPTPGYACIFNAPVQIDRRNGSGTASAPFNKVVISAMDLRVLYYNPATAGISFGAEAIRTSLTPEVMGTCRGQFTDLPDGKTKILYANFSPDQYLNLAYDYVRPDALSPRRQSKIRLMTSGAGTSPVTELYTYSKKKMQVRLVNVSALNDPTNLSKTMMIKVEGGENDDTSNGLAFGAPTFLGPQYIHADYSFSFSTLKTQSPASITQFSVEDLDPYVVISFVPTLSTEGRPKPYMYVDLVD